MKKLNDYQKKQVKLVLSDKLGFDYEDISDESYLRGDLGTDSLDEVELIMEFEKIFNIDIPDNLAEKINKVSDIYDCLQNCH